MSNTTNNQYFPWSWSVSSQFEHPSCPPSSSILGLYAAINAICTVLSVLAGNSFIIRTITCGLFGNEDGKPWRYMWILPFSLQLGANACIAALTKAVPGYDNQFKIWELMLFYTLRPRLAWIILGLIAEADTKHGKPWRTSFISNMYAEVLLQLIALYTAGTVVRFAAVRGYYLVHTEAYRALPNGAHLFYAGSLYYLIAGCEYLTIVGLGFMEYADPEDDAEDNDVGAVAIVSVLLVTTWLASWLFWSGFV
jgi:hypothetical protein